MGEARRQVRATGVPLPIDSGSHARQRGAMFNVETIALMAAIVAVAMWQFGRTVADPDLWGHVRFGMDKIEAGHYLSGDVYSYLTQGRVWFNHEWLGEVVMGALYLVAGPAGLVVFKALLAVALVLFFMWWLLRSRVPPVRVGILMALSIVLLTPTLGTFRPQLFTTVLFTATLVVIVAYTRGKTRLIWILPMMFAVWVNLHGGVLSGVAVLWVWALLRFVLRRDRAWEPVVVAGASSAVLVVNPQGVAHVRFLIESTTVGRPEIVEWSSLDLLSAVGVAYVVLAVLVGVSLLRSRREADLTLLVPLVALMAAPLVAWRHLQLFVPAFVILGGRYLGLMLVTDGTRSESRSRPSSVAAGIFILLAIAAGVFAAVRVARATNCIVVEASQFDYPARAVHALATSGVSGNAVVTFNWGEYIIWHLGPDVRVSIDGRRETVYSDDVLWANLDFANGVGEWNRVLDLAPADTVIQATGTPGAVLMSSEPGWRLVYEDSTASVFAPVSKPLELKGDDAIPVDGNGLCFGMENHER